MMPQIDASTSSPKILPTRRVTLPKPVPSLNAAEMPAIIVLGLDAGGKPHAARFAETDTALATKAAGMMGFATLPVTTDEVRDLALRLPAGRVFASGKAFCPFVRRPTYDTLIKCEGLAWPQAAEPGQRALGGAEGHDEALATPEGSANDVDDAGEGPDDDLMVAGRVVLAREEPEPGWYEATIVEDAGAGILTLEWRGFPDLGPFHRRREHVVPLPAALVAKA